MKFSKHIATVSAAILTLYSLTFAAGGSGSQVISQVKVNSDGKVNILGQGGDWKNPDTCISSSSLVLLPDHAFYSEIYALLVSSYLQGKSVSARLKNCDDSNPIMINATSN